jgi:SAM-dependent methyltransferase
MPEPNVDTFGDPSHPVILLAGVGDTEFATRLSAGARYVLRYDGGDSPDPVDVIGLLDRRTGVHLVVLAERGELARQVALARPDRVASLVLLGSAAVDPMDVDTAIPMLVTEDDDPVPTILHHTSGGWDPQADRLAAIALAAGQPTAWFEQLYSSARRGEVPMPWDRDQPNFLLTQWTEGLAGEGRRALVVGCGLGADAEHLARLGFDTDAFDVSETAIETARARHPDSAVRYRTADLLDPPADLLGAFDLVVEIYTVQALPVTVRQTAITNVTRMVAPNGTLVAIGVGPYEKDGPISGPPWPLSRAEIESFGSSELIQVNIVEHRDHGDPGWFRWTGEFRHVGRAPDDQDSDETA